MLSLGREEGQYIMIGDDIKIQVIKSDKGKLRLAVQCPDHLPIIRGEIYEQRKKVEKR